MKRKEIREFKDILKDEKKELIVYVDGLEKKINDLEARVPSKLRLWLHRIILIIYGIYLIYDNRPEQGVSIFLGM